jgi:phospholipase/carboxylesterase
LPPDPQPRLVRLREAGQPRGSADCAGILLHGRSRTKQEMLDLAGGLGVEGARWLAPYAGGGLWYPGRYMDPREVNEPQLTRSVERCHWLVLEASEGGRLGPEQIFIVGFSQGACVAVEYVLRHPASVAVVVVFTGCLIGPPGAVWSTAGGQSLKGLSVLLTGSDADEWIDLERTLETAEVLRGLGAEVETHIYPGRAHVVSEEELAAARAFLRARGF